LGGVEGISLKGRSILGFSELPLVRTNDLLLVWSGSETEAGAENKTSESYYIDR
jgi:hypothetical protein